MPCSLPVRSRVVMIVTPVAKEPSALRNSRALKPSAEVLCTVALWLPGSSPGNGADTLASSTLGLVGRLGRGVSGEAADLEGGIRRQAERDATVHSPVNVPIQHIMCVGGMDIAECPLERVLRIDRAAAGCGEQDVHRLGAQSRGEGAVAAIAGAVREICLLYTSPSPRDRQKSRMP